MPRTNTDKLIALMDEGIMDGEVLATILLTYMSDSEVGCAISNMPDFEGYGLEDDEDEDEDEEEENDFDDITLTNIVWESDDLDNAPDLPKTVELSLISEMLTSGDEYDRTEIEDWLEDKFCMPAVSFDVETD